MPELNGRAKEVYVKSYGQETYDAYTDIHTVHGRERLIDPPPTPEFYHRPDHDVESIFWVLVFALITAKPEDAPDEPTPTFFEAMEWFQTHSIKEVMLTDSRNPFLNLSHKHWAEILHPRLASLIGMMQELSTQVRPEYGLLQPPPAEDHLHEAFRRILLKQILSMNDDIPLTPNVSRELSAARSTTTLRDSEELVHREKRKRGGEDSEFSTRPHKVARTVGSVPSFSPYDSHYYNR